MTNLGCLNYNNYGFMSVNYPLRAGEFLASDHPARRVIETRFRQHALRYANLVRKLVAPCGDTWPFGRSAGVLGQLQCVVLIEQCLSKKWIEPKDVNQFRAIARLATKRMHDLYWDESRQWFNFRDEFQTAYDYRASHPMAWDMLRYFLQIERYAAADERYGVPDEESVAHGGPRHEEIVTNPALKTAIYVWSDGRDHAVLPIMAGPHHITGDALARPYAQGLFEWSTQHTVAALCPRLLIDGESYWPAWHAKHTKLETDGAESIYQVHFGRIVSDEGKACASEVDCETSYVFSSGVFRRIDIWTVTQQLVIDDFALEVLQPAKHPRRPQFGEVHELDVTWISEIEAIRLTGRLDVSALPVYRNYHGHASHSWKIRGSQIRLERGQYRTELRLRW